MLLSDNVSANGNNCLSFFSFPLVLKSSQHKNRKKKLLLTENTNSVAQVYTWLKKNDRKNCLFAVTSFLTPLIFPVVQIKITIFSKYFSLVILVCALTVYLFTGFAEGHKKFYFARLRKKRFCHAHALKGKSA